MATGRLAAASLTALTNTTIYTVPALKTTVCTINLCNTGSTVIKVRVAIAAANPPVAGEYLEYDASIPASGVLERAGIVLDAGKLLIVYADTANINATAWGYEE